MNEKEFNQDSFNNYDLNRTSPEMGAMDASSLSLQQYIQRTYLWMASGLLLTFAVAYFIARSPRILMAVYQNPAILIAATVAELIVVFVLSLRIRKLSVGTARILFYAYAALTGITFSLYFVMFDINILVYAFLATAILFGGMALVAHVMKLQLDSIRPFLFAGLIFLLIFTVIGLFVNLGAFEMVLMYFGVALFLGYTAYDTTKIRDNYYFYTQHGDNVMLQKAAIFSALQLYLDFINLFIRILRIISNRRSN